MIIYILINKVNGKSYVGQTSGTLDTRVKGHIKTKHGHMLICSALRKYGREQFDERILLYCEPDEANFYEEQLIAKLTTRTPNGYNLTVGGVGARGHKLTEETKAKMRIASTGRLHTPEARQKMSEKAKNRTEEHRRKISENMKRQWADRNSKLYQGHVGKPRSAETKEKLSNTLRGRPQPKNLGHNRKHSAETKQKISVSLKRFRAVNLAENSPAVTAAG